MVRWKRSTLLHCTLRSLLSGAVDSDIFLTAADVIESLDTVDRSILDRVLSSLGLRALFRHAFFEFHVRLRFKLAAGLGEPWTRDGDVYCCVCVSIWLPRRVLSLSCMLTISSVCLVIPMYFCVLLSFTAGYERLVGQEPAASE